LTEYKIEKPKLVAAFDASGKEDTPCIVVAGFISSPVDWDKFDNEWTDRLKHDRLAYFHMVEFAHSKKEFTDWKGDESRRQNLFGDLIDIIIRNVYRQAGCAIDMKNFSTLSAEAKQEASLNAYVLAARTCAADIRRWQEKERFVVPTAYVFEDGDEGKGKLTTRFTEDALPVPHFKPKTAYTKDGITHNAFTPLQAADILAYEVHKPYRDLATGSLVERFRWGFEELSKIPGVVGHYSPENIETLNNMLTILGKNN
jgi:hypothetical protein